MCGCGFPIYRCYEGIVGSQANKDTQERYGTIIFGIFYFVVYVGVNRADVLDDLTTVFTLLDDKCVIQYLSQSLGGWGQI